MLVMGFSELQRAYAKHNMAYTRDPNPLVLFYAVECGLKAIWMRRNNVKRTDTIESILRREGHDLSFWAKELRLARPLTGGPISFRLRRDNSSVALDLSHQAWRYGVDIIEEDELEVIAWLQAIAGWIGKEINS